MRQVRVATKMRTAVVDKARGTITQLPPGDKGNSIFLVGGNGNWLLRQRVRSPVSGFG